MYWKNFTIQINSFLRDFNYSEIDYKNYTVKIGEETAAYKFKKMQDLHFVQNVDQVTRIRSRNTPSILDYIFTDDKNLIENMEYEIRIGESDHIYISWDCIVEVLEGLQGKKLNYWKGNYDVIRHDLLQINWEV
jgi:hypothetical protein